MNRQRVGHICPSPTARVGLSWSSQPDQVALLKNLSFKLDVSLTLVPRELLQKTVDVISRTYKEYKLRLTHLIEN